MKLQNNTPNPTNLYCQFIKRNCRNETGKHLSSRLLGIVERRDVPEDGHDPMFDNHPAMPKKCDVCDYVFTDTDKKSVFYLRLYGNRHKNNLVTVNGAKGNEKSTKIGSTSKGRR